MNTTDSPRELRASPYESWPEGTEDYEVRMPSGSLVRVDVGGEVVEIRDPSGSLQVRVRTAGDTSTVQLAGQQLELTADERVSIRSRRVEIQASEGASLGTKGEFSLWAGGGLRLVSGTELRMVGPTIFLN